MMEIKCRDCLQVFQGQFIRGCFPVRCPKCADIAQHRPEIVESRNLLYSEVICLKSLPGEFKLFQSSSKDFPVWKLSFKGKEWGVNWDGRIDIFCPDTLPPMLGKNYLLEVIEVSHYVLRFQELKKREYLRLTPAAQETDKELIWLQVKSKTTLKGLGRQYQYDIVGNPLWEKRISGGYRNLRAYNTGVLAVVDAAHQLTIEKIFDY